MTHGKMDEALHEYVDEWSSEPPVMAVLGFKAGYMAALHKEAEKYRKALEKINELRNDIVRTQTLGWSGHAYPLARILNEAGFEADPLAVEAATCNYSSGRFSANLLGDDPAITIP